MSLRSHFASLRVSLSLPEPDELADTVMSQIRPGPGEFDATALSLHASHSISEVGPGGIPLAGAGATHEVEAVATHEVE